MSPSPSPRLVQVRILRISDLPSHSPFLTEGGAFLSSEERRALTRISRPEVQLRARLSRILTRTQLSSLDPSCTPEQWQFQRSARGKPSSAQTHYQFNISHSGDWLVFAATAQLSLGVDVECESPRLSPAQLVERFFHPEEAAIFRTLTPPQQIAHFYRSWTLKEAYLKATGSGISHHLAQLIHRAPEQLLFSAELAENPAHWFFHQQELSPGVHFALAVHNPEAQPLRVMIQEPLWLPAWSKRGTTPQA